MAEGQRKRSIGKGMKPRGNQRVKPQKGVNGMAQQFTVEGQQQTPLEAVVEPQVGNKTPDHLEPENGGNLLQNLEKTEAIVAADDGLEAALEESGDGKPTGEDLDSAAEQGGYHFSGPAGAVESPEPETVDLETAMAVGSGTVGEVDAATYNIRNSSGRAMAPAIIYESTNGAEGIARVGLQPDGSTKVVVTIQEGYWEAVKQWAEADGVPVERWLSDRLYEYISTYGEPARTR